MSNSAAVNTGAIEKIFQAGATVISHLIDKTVTAGPVSATATDSSLKLDSGWVILLAEIPAGNITFCVRFESKAIIELVKIMMGGGDELGAIGDSMTAEITSQIASTMAEELATQNSWATNGIAAKVCSDAKLIPPPPLSTCMSELDIAGSVQLQVAVDFDLPAANRTGINQAPAAVAAPADQELVKQTPGGRAPKVPSSASFSNMTPTSNVREGAKLDFVHDVPMTVRALLGSSRLPLREVVGMQNGSVFELNRSSEEPIELYVNNILIARGEVVVVDDRYAVKISELNPIGSSSGR